MITRYYILHNGERVYDDEAEHHMERVCDACRKPVSDTVQGEQPDDSRAVVLDFTVRRGSERGHESFLLHEACAPPLILGALKPVPAPAESKAQEAP